jgi:branched-chain amino acid aminotransferase
MTERAWLYGDLLFETIRVSGGLIHHAAEHYQRLQRSAAILQFDTASFTEADFLQTIRQALGNRTDARVRFVLHRHSEGFYTPASNEVAWSADIFPPVTQEKVCRKLGVFSDYKKPCHALSNIKSGNALLYVMAGLYARGQGFDDCVILNEHGRVAEASSSNIFIRKGDTLITPPVTEGCVEGVMREIILRQCAALGKTVVQSPVHIHELGEADEVFLSNAIYGIVPVASFGDKVYEPAFAAYLKPLTGI